MTLRVLTMALGQSSLLVISLEGRWRTVCMGSLGFLLLGGDGFSEVLRPHVGGGT